MEFTMQQPEVSVSIEDVEAHLHNMGYTNIPDSVLHNFTSELIARLSSTSLASQIEHGRQPAQPSDEGKLRPRSASQLNSDKSRRNIKAVHQRGTRLSKKPMDQELLDNQTDGNLNSAAAHVAPRDNEHSPRHDHDGVENIYAARRIVGKDASSVGVRSSTSFIRPHTQNGRTKRTDPVAKYFEFKQSWNNAPAVTGARKQQVQHVQSTKSPHDKPIWKAVHPMENSVGTSGYQVPTTKKRVEVMCSVREVLKWNEVYKPHKTDRVEANQAALAYVIPDDKRRDELRWHTRLMMNS